MSAVRLVKLLVDENLSTVAVEALRAAGVDAVHVRERALLGRPDPEVFEYALSEDRVFVTANVEDFVALARVSEVHCGVALVEEGGLLRPEQLQMLRRIVALLHAEFEAGRSLDNRLLHVWLGGQHTFEDVPGWR